MGCCRGSRKTSDEEHCSPGDFDPASDTIKVITMKVSKGLELPVVALPGVGHMPAKGKAEEEAAGVFYVAATRATQRLVIGVGGERVRKDYIKSAATLIARQPHRRRLLWLFGSSFLYRDERKLLLLCRFRKVKLLDGHPLHPYSKCIVPHGPVARDYKGGTQALANRDYLSVNLDFLPGCNRFVFLVTCVQCCTVNLCKLKSCSTIEVGHHQESLSV